MDEEKFQQIKSIFDEALNYKKEERESFLNEKCGSDLELKNEILSLLSSIEKSDDFLEQQKIFMKLRRDLKILLLESKSLIS